MDIINGAGLMCLYYVALSMGAALSTVPRPPDCPSARPAPLIFSKQKKSRNFYLVET